MVDFMEPLAVWERVMVVLVVALDDNVIVHCVQHGAAALVAMGTASPPGLHAAGPMLQVFVTAPV